MDSGTCVECAAGRFGGSAGLVAADGCTACPQFASSLAGSVAVEECECPVNSSLDAGVCKVRSTLFFILLLLLFFVFILFLKKLKMKQTKIKTK